MTTSPALEVAALGARRGGARVFEGVSFQVAAGAVHALVGPNGSGKSTLIQCVLGLHPFEGRITRVDGALGYVPQTFRPEPALALTVGEFLSLGRASRPVCLGLGAAGRARVEAALARVGLAGFAPRSLHALSGGELKRVLLADALERAPGLLLLDEPWAGLDEASASALEAALRVHQQRGGAALLVTHDPEQVRRLSATVTRLGGPSAHA